MAFDMHIKNIGKLNDANISVGQFTVFAGPNNTGKSYVSKLLYSLFDAMNANHAEVYVNNLTDPIKSRLDRLGRWYLSDDKDAPLMSLNEQVDAIRSLAKESSLGDLESLDKIIHDIAVRAQNIRKKFPEVCSSLKSKSEKEIRRAPNSLVDRNLKDVEKLLNELQSGINSMNAKLITVAGLEYKIRENLIRNFQVPKISDLAGRKNGESGASIKSIGKFKFSNENVGFRVESAGLMKLQEYSKVIYLESPIYWKLKIALEDIRSAYSYRGRIPIGGVPEYFYDLASALRHEYLGEFVFSDLYETLIDKDVLGGKIVISKSGNLYFTENERSFPLHATAMGVANLGMLALLLERKVLDEESFLFIDEPEAHLHPAWQVIMAKTLFALAKKGTNVVIATHSIEILKWLEVHIKRNPDDERLVALNMFSDKGVNVLEQDFAGKISAIKEELTKPFADLYVDGL